MARRRNVNEINLQIDKIEVYPSYTTNEGKFVHDGCIRIFWSASIGFGQYDLYKDEKGKWHGDSECMDDNEDKDFIKKLLSLMFEELNISG
jgi:hypothetical protein